MAKINEIDITSLTFQEGSAPTTPASTKWKAYFKTDGLYVIDDAGSETGPLSTGGGSGSAPEWVNYLAARQTGETSHADDDFFDDDSLAGTAVDGSGSTATWTEIYGRMSAVVDGTGAFPPEVSARVFALTPSSAPVTLETCVSALWNPVSDGSPAVVVGFSNGATAGSSIAAAYFYESGGIVKIYNYEGTFNNASAPTLWTNQLGQLEKILVRAVWTASNTFQYSFAVPGGPFVDLEQASHSRTLTPTHFFVGLANTGAPPMPVSFDYVRINESDLSP